jgi:mRNA interferase MazF
MKHTEKDFDGWNKLKKYLDSKSRLIYAHPREIWWCSLGINIGTEINGKNTNFERPVILLKVYNKESLIVLPITTREKDDQFHYKIETQGKIAWVKLTQIRMISSKRLLRKIGSLDKESFSKLKIIWKDSL